jgi:hypothetical protein
MRQSFPTFREGSTKKRQRFVTIEVEKPDTRFGRDRFPDRLAEGTSHPDREIHSVVHRRAPNALRDLPDVEPTAIP